MKTTDEQLENLCGHVLTSMGRSSLLYQALEELRELRSSRCPWCGRHNNDAKTRPMAPMFGESPQSTATPPIQTEDVYGVCGVCGMKSEDHKLGNASCVNFPRHEGKVAEEHGFARATEAEQTERFDKETK